MSTPDEQEVSEVEQADIAIAEAIATDPELVALRAKRAEIRKELEAIVPGVAVGGNPNPWPTLLRTLFPEVEQRLAFERQVMREMIASMEAELPTMRENLARMRLGVAPVSGQQEAGTGRNQRLGVVHDGRTTKQG